MFKCSACGFTLDDLSVDSKVFNYCPVCGESTHPIPYIAVGNDELDSKMISYPCECGGHFKFTMAEFLNCGWDDDHPRPRCDTCGREVKIGHFKVWKDGEWV